MMHRSPLHALAIRFETQMESEEANEYMAHKTTTFGVEGIVAYCVKHEKTGLELRVETSEHRTRIKYTYRLNEIGSHQEVSLETPPNQIVKALNHLVNFHQNILRLQEAG